MKIYESMFVVDGQVQDPEVDKLIEKFKQIILSYKGEIIKAEKMGKRELSYEIRGMKEGTYIYLEINSEKEGISELERNYSITDSIIRQLTVRKIIPRQIKERKKKVKPSKISTTPTSPVSSDIKKETAI
ncbi:MAG: 30S ribosomal protein S6 [Candidatus Firestonebacteria bacterium]